MEFNSIGEILRHKFIGNFRDDDAAFAAMEVFQRTASKRDRELAERHMTMAGMGERDIYPHLAQEAEQLTAE